KSLSPLSLADAGPVSVTIPASPFMQKLGYGTGVNVYLMKRSPRGLSRSPWAIKKISSKCNRSQQSLYRERLKEEAKILRDLQHPNIVGEFPGRGHRESWSPPHLPSPEFLPDLPSLPALWHWEAIPCVPSLQPLSPGTQPGIPYLHCDKKLLHGDIKSSNVVVRGDFEAVKICDVGVSLPLDENMTVSDPRLCYVGTEPWKPKEALEEGGIITDKSDIFPFGLTLWEMMTLSIPHLDLG
ncbi:TOPK kinase, partial [Mionectes macconnelli]|nr:TOPK kinase [Mionectes macconnelli]